MKHSLRLVLVLATALLGFARLQAAMDMKADIVSSYVKVASALADDDLSAAKSAATEVAGHASMSDLGDVATKASAVAKADKIDAARTAFKALSTAVEPLAAGMSNYVVMNCPMVRADWVQAKGSTRNPYMGKAMLTCGAPKAAK